MDKDTKVWNLLKAMNYENVGEQRIFLQKDGQTLQWKRAANIFC